MTAPKVLPGLEPLLVPIENLSHLPGNARQGDPEAVAKSLDKFGQHKALVARQTGMGDNGHPLGEVLIGNHTLKGAKLLGWTHIAAVFTDDDEITAKARALADNRASDLGGYDEDALAEMIADVLDADEALLEATSFTMDDLDDLLGSSVGVDIDDEEDSEDESEGNTDATSEDTAPRPAPERASLSLFDRFMVPPFSVLNAREGWWKDRKRSWIALGLEGELGRDDKPRTWFLAPPERHHNPNRPLVEMGAAERRVQEDSGE